MLKKYLIVIFIILSFIISKDIFFKSNTDASYTEIIKKFKKDYESTEKISSESLYEYKEFLYENGAKSDKFIIDTYIKYVDNIISQEEEENIKSNIYESKYLNSKILGGKLLYKYYLENNKATEAKELIIDIFNQIKRSQFKNNEDEIVYFLEMVSSEADDKSISIEILEDLQDNEYVTDRIKLKIYDELRYLYLYINNYALASEVSIKSIIIANQQNLNEETSEGLIELAQLFKRLGGIETGIELIKKSLSIEIEDEFKDADIKTYGLLTLGELYLTNGDYKNAKLISDKISNYKDSMPIETYRDIEILKANMDARIAIMEGDLKLAKEYLNNAKYLQEIDKEDYYVGKDISYSLALGQFYEESNQYEDAIKLYESMLDKNKDNKYIIEQILENLIRVENDESKKNDYYRMLMELRENQEDERYGDYTFYILDKINNENELIEKNKSISKYYRLIIILIVAGGLIIRILFNKIKNIKINSKQDVLVNAYNRRHFDITYKRLLIKNKLFSIIILDLDNFKSINDNFGHDLGDIVLINTCKAIQPLLDEQSSLFRYGGEEFVVIVQDKSREEVLQLAENIRAKVESLHWKEDIVTTLSIGVAHSDANGSNTFKKADEKLYVSKKTGKNKVTS